MFRFIFFTSLLILSCFPIFLSVLTYHAYDTLPGDLATVVGFRSGRIRSTIRTGRDSFWTSLDVVHDVKSYFYIHDSLIIKKNTHSMLSLLTVRAVLTLGELSVPKSGTICLAK